jgi:ribonuclease-3
MKCSEEKISERAEQLAHQLKLEKECVQLLEQALKHSSFVSDSRINNQRLEFLGDRVLAFVIAEELMERYPEDAEGDLTLRLNELVSKDCCFSVAQNFELGKYMLMSKSEMHTGGRKKKAILADALESVIAAVYLGSGWKAARNLILHVWQPFLDNQTHAPRDAKTTLQEYLQGMGNAPPKYAIEDKQGSDHDPVFFVSVTLEDGASTQGVGSSKREAEQSAALKLLDLIKGR